MFEDKIQQVRKAETISYTGKIENIVGMSIEASVRFTTENPVDRSWRR